MQESYRAALIEGELQGARYTLAPPTVASDGVVGAQLANRAGSSIEFMDHRDYQPGDDIRRIDWSAYARSDRLALRLYREEVSPHLDLVIDGSRSMNIAQSRKADATLGLAAALCAAADNSRFTHQAFIGRDRIDPIEHGSDRPGTWAGLTFEHTKPLGEALAQSTPKMRRQGVRVLVSDLLWMDEPLPILSRLADGCASMVVVQMLAQSDVTPPDRGNLRLVDSETQQVREVFIDAATQQRYRDALQRHQENWQRACRQIGALMLTMVAEDFVSDWDLSLFAQHDVLRVV